MQVRDYMNKRPIVVGADDFVAKAEAKMRDGAFRRLPVVHEGTLVGIITDRDIRQYKGVSDKVRIHSAMTHPVRTVAPDDEIEKAAHLMLQHNIGGLPVVQEHEVVGMITTDDLLRVLVDVLEGNKRRPTSPSAKVFTRYGK
jgi:acetoin utilization protein AcuB